MATPSAATFKARYVEFETVADLRCDLFLVEADTDVGLWPETDRTVAINALAAHRLALEGEPGLSAGDGRSAAEAASTGALASVKVGDVEERYHTASGATGGLDGAPTGYGSTPYGRRYLEIMRRHVPSIIAV